MGGQGDDNNRAQPLAARVAERASGLRKWLKLGNLKRLFTHEDSQQVHKTLGVLVLASIIYRYGFVYRKTGQLGFESENSGDDAIFDWVNISVHLALSSSAMIFHVLSKRLRAQPMIMWNEYRLHAIVFTLRCFSVYAFSQVRPWKDTDKERVALYCVVMIHHVLADYISKKFGKPGTTAVRNTQDSSAFIRFIQRFYSFYQFLALGSHLIPSTHLGDHGYNTLIAIQSSAFLMTLCRKNIISYLSHGFWYTLALILSSFVIINNQVGYSFILSIFTLFFFRMVGFNKYFLWAIFVLSTSDLIKHTVNFTMHGSEHLVGAFAPSQMSFATVTRLAGMGCLAYGFQFGSRGRMKTALSELS